MQRDDSLVPISDQGWRVLDLVKKDPKQASQLMAALSKKSGFLWSATRLQGTRGAHRTCCFCSMTIKVSEWSIISEIGRSSGS